uniref:Uncharacterized protein n=1 Tax=Romanomermis culicivorax TaxID=13658 RepID=A0A915I9T8_ROMCU
MGQSGSRIELAEDLLSDEERTVMFHPDLEAHLQKYSFLNNIDLAAFYMHFMFGCILTLPYTDLKAKLDLEYFYINYQKNVDDRPGLLKLIAIRQNPTTYIRTLVFRTVNFDTKFETTSDFGTTNDVLQILKILHDLGHNLDNYRIPPIYHYKFSQVPPDTNYVVYDEESTYETIANDNTPIKIDYIRSNELASKVFQLDNLIVNKNFDRLELDYVNILNLKATDEFMHLPSLEIDELNVEQVKDSVKSFLETMATIYRFYSEELPFLALASNSLGNMAFAYGAITLNFKENAQIECIADISESFEYKSYHFARIEMKVNSKLVGKSLFNMPVILQFSHEGYEYSTYNLIQQVKQYKKILLSTLYRYEAKEALFNAVNFNYVVGVVQQIRMPIARAPALIQQLLNIKLEELQGQELMETTVRKIMTVVNSIYPKNRLHFLDRGRYLSRYVLGEASITQRRPDQSVYLADDIEKDSWKPLPWISDKDIQETKDKITTFVIGNELTKTDINLNFIEYTGGRILDNESGKLAGEILNKYQPKTTSLSVEKVVTINIWTSFHHTIQDFKVRDRLPKDFIMIALSSQVHYPQMGSSRNIRPINHINMDEQFNLVENKKIDEAVLISDTENNDVFEFLIKNNNLLPGSSDLAAVVEGLFSRMHYSKLMLHSYDSRKVELAVFGESGEAKFIFSLDLGRVYQSEFESTINILSDFQSVQSYVKNTNKFGDENFQIIAATTNGERDGYFPRVIVGERRSETTDIMAFLTQCMRNARKKRSTKVCPKSNHGLKKMEEKMARMQGSSSLQTSDIGQHLQKVGRVANIMMLSLIGKNIIADLIKEDYAGIAISLGFIAGATALTFFGNKLESYGAKLAATGNIISSNIVNLSASVLGRIMAGFVVYDLIGNIKQYEESHDSSSIVNIAADSGFLLIEGVQMSILGLEYTGLISGISSTAGPIGAAAGVSLLLGADIYSAVHQVQKIKENIDMTSAEIWLTGLRDFVGLEPEQYLTDLMEEKKANEYILNKMTQNLTSDIAYIVMPMAFIKSKQIHIQPNNKIDLINGTWNHAGQRIMPNLPGYMEFFCYPDNIRYMCIDAFGVKLKNSTGNSTLIELLDGNDTVYGMQNMKNIIHMGNGNKTILGGFNNDQFILKGDRTIGFLDGRSGFNTLNLANFRQKEFVRVDENFISYFEDVFEQRHTVKKITFYNIQEIIGRHGKPEIMMATCETKRLASGGGNQHEPDIIVIYESEICEYSMNIALNSWTFVEQYASRGQFNYLMKSNLTGDVQIKMLSKNSQAQHTILIKDALTELKNIFFNETYTEFEFQYSSMKMINFDKSVKFYVGSGCMIDIGKHLTIYKIRNTTDDVESVVSNNLNVIRKFNATMIIFMLLSKTTIIMGQMQKRTEKHVTFENDPPHESHIFGGQAENVYVIKSKDMTTLFTPPVFIYEAGNPASSDIINIEFYQRFLKSKSSSDEIQLEVGIVSRDIQIQVKKTNFTHNVTLVKIHLRNFLEGEKFKRLMIVNYYLSVLVIARENLALQPLPLEFHNASIIGISNFDIEWKNEIIIHNNLTEFNLYNYEDEDLIITNIFAKREQNTQVLTILLKNFYRSAKMKSINIRFENSLTLKMDEERFSDTKIVLIVNKTSFNLITNAEILETILHR